MFMALDRRDLEGMSESHMKLGDQIMNFVHDLGEDCHVILSLDDQDNPEDSEFCIHFTGTDMYLHYTYEGILIERVSEEDENEEEILKVFPLERTNEATHWLLTQEN